jgi:hypothetical protein
MLKIEARVIAPPTLSPARVIPGHRQPLLSPQEYPLVKWAEIVFA